MRVSVVIPLPDHRGMAQDAIDCWTRKIDFAPDEYEIIITSDGRDEALEKSIASSLRVHDQFIVDAGSNLLRLVNVGVEAASSELLFITESHCLPKSDCLTELARHFEGCDDVIACCSSDGINHSTIAELEQRIFEEDFKIRCQPDFWNKVTIRGFGMLRSVFMKEKGFPSQFGHFGEPVFGAHLHAKGYKMGYASKVMVSHYNNPTLKYLIPALQEYGSSMVNYFINGNLDYAESYFEGDLHRYKTIRSARLPKLYFRRNKLRRKVRRFGSKLSSMDYDKDAMYADYKELWSTCIHLGVIEGVMRSKLGFGINQATYD